MTNFYYITPALEKQVIIKDMDDTEDSDIDILIISSFIDEIESYIDDEVVNVILDKEEIISAHLMSENHFNQTKNWDC